jgi:hypothetical protein
MSSTHEPGRLDHRHQDTLRQVFRHPASHNIEWHAVLSLLEATGIVSARHDGKVAVTLGSERMVLEPPHGKSISIQMVGDLRRMLAEAGYDPS